MKNIKKLLAILLVLTMALSLAACGPPDGQRRQED